MVTLRHPLPGSRLTPGRGFTGPLPGHTGIDLSYGGGSCGKPVVAAADGVAKRAENLGGGHGVVIRHADGVETGYWHLSRQLVGGLLGGDQIVRAGQVIGAVGASGTAASGCHLHFEVKVGGQLRDPLPLLGGQVVTAGDDRPPFVPVNADGTCPPGYVKGSTSGVIRCRLPSAYVGAEDIPGALAGAVIGPLLPVLSNLAIVVVALLIGWAGVRQVLGAR